MEEREMRASEVVELGQDITPPLIPLAASLYDSFISSHCSSCFSPLPLPPLIPTDPFFYCSASCSSNDTHLRLPTAQSLPPDNLDTADIRAALRFLHFTSPQPSNRYHDRISGLLTNRDRLLSSPEFSGKIRAGARVLAAARRLQDENVGETEDFSLEEAALCLVITNAVEVQDNEGRSLGIAVYPPSFSWINHSCSPNACYRFLISPPDVPSHSGESTLRIIPGVAGSKEMQGGRDDCSSIGYIQKEGGYGLSIIVRSIKRIKQGEEVTISYTDLLQPKAMRQSDLWSKYQFLCSCPRCSASPPTYVDRALEEISASELNFSNLYSSGNLDRDETTRKLTDYVDEIIAEYLSGGDPESCCEKVENMLNLGLLIEELNHEKGESCVNIKLHPLHHLALNAYTTLTSAYKIRSNDLLALISKTGKPQPEAFQASRASAAYSLLLAGTTHYLFRSESSLIVSAANYWANAGESLITLVENSAWSFLTNSAELSSLAKHKCSKCSLMDIFNANTVSMQGKPADFEFISRQFLDCVTDMIPNIWGSLVHGLHYLQKIQDPIDFSWIVNMPEAEDNCFRGEALGRHSDEERVNVYCLAVHCLLYAGLLANICYGENSSLCRHIINILRIH